MPTNWTHAYLPPAFSLAQADLFDETTATAPAEPPARHPMSFSDFKQGMRDVHSGKVDDSGFRNGIIVILAVIGLIALIIHLRQRRQNATAPDSLGKLGWELSRGVRFPFASRVMLYWVAKSTKTPFASLLLSENLFKSRVGLWEAEPTFSVARHWGRGRLDLLRPVLFDAPGAAAPANVPA